MNDQEVEKEIQEKGLTAPRITPQRIEDVVIGEDSIIIEEDLNLIQSNA